MATGDFFRTSSEKEIARKRDEIYSPRVVPSIKRNAASGRFMGRRADDLFKAARSERAQQSPMEVSFMMEPIATLLKQFFSY